MTEKEIMTSYEQMKPDKEARRRMLGKIQVMAKEGDREGKEGYDMKIKSKNMVRFATAAAVVLSVSTVGYASGIFHLNDVNSGKQTIDYPKLEQPYEVDTVSLHGIAGSPEYEACKEWEDFQEKYDADEKILSKVGNNLVGLGEYETIYGCYTQEMADKVDEICKKYKLSKLTSCQLVQGEKKLCKQIGIKNLFREEKAAGMEQEFAPEGYYYADGTFHLDCSMKLGEMDSAADYQMSRSVKGTFQYVGGLNVGDLSKYKQWEYVTASGETVLLANNHSSKALIIADREKSFVVINVLGNILEGSFNISNKVLEAMADTIDFAAIP